MTARDALAAIRERAEDATRGPWEEMATLPPSGEVYYSVDAVTGREVARLPHNPQGSEDTRFIAHARTDVPALVEALESVLVYIEEWELIRDKCPTDYAQGKFMGHDDVRSIIERKLRNL